MCQADAPDLPPGEMFEAVAASTYGICEYLDRFRLDDGRQKATGKNHHVGGVFRRTGYDADSPGSGCCGVAGRFGYEAEQFSLSRAIGDIRFERVEERGAVFITALGAFAECN